MKKRDFYLPSSDGKSRLHCVEWLPDGAELQTVKLWVQLVHGMNEHMGRYGEFASFLAEHGIAVIGHDCLGHGSTAAYGATELSKEDRGFFAAENGGAFLLRDMRRVASYGAKRYPNAKHIMLGHSMGSFLTRRYLSAYPGKEPDGAGSAAPGVCRSGGEPDGRQGRRCDSCTFHHGPAARTDRGYCKAENRSRG